MSVNRENLIWQSPDSTWSRGFFTCIPRSWSEDGGEPDPEWDVDYEMDSFEWVSTGHPTEEAAARSWDGANPGGHWTHRYTDGAARESLNYDVMAAELEITEDKRTAGADRRYSWGQYSNYEGPSKASQPAVANEMLDRLDKKLAETDAAQLSYQLQGYGNDLSRDAADALARRSELLDRMQRDGMDTRERERGETQARLRLAALRKLDAEEAERRRQPQRARSFSYGYQRPNPMVTKAQADLVEQLRQAEADVARLDTEKTRTAKKATAKTTTQPTAQRTGASGVQGRVPSGVPSGGQFAARQHPESDVTL